ncbi:precursor of CEP1-like [Tripterygium wilfordii]|uniref:precursor of CEP1-like n=1 Tax=Tripterygium wilfordii TaxID=458696 RepID=UPI0018F83CBA|nr:precursor of CEP1-like [Tripterygium wilfordii]
MANVKLIVSTTFLFLVLLFSWGSIRFTEARLSKMSGNYGNNNLITNIEGNYDVVKSRRMALQDEVVGSVAGNIGPDAANNDDFRPTTPGHSPGAGHSTGPGSEEPL